MSRKKGKHVPEDPCPVCGWEWEKVRYVPFEETECVVCSSCGEVKQHFLGHVCRMPMMKDGSMFGKSESYVSKLLYVYDNAGEKQWDVIIGDGIEDDLTPEILWNIKDNNEMEAQILNYLFPVKERADELKAQFYEEINRLGGADYTREESK